jgi:phage-related baseplate assembly protein
LAETVTTIVTSVTGFTTVLNTTPISGGRDTETDEELTARAKLVYTGNNVGTPDGIKQLILDNTTVSDVLVVSTGDPALSRADGVGVVDVYLKEQNIQAAQETFTNFNDPLHPLSIIPNKRPVVALTSVSSGVATLEEDTTSVLAGSVKSKSRFDFSGGAPSFPVTISYLYDANVENAQRLVMQPENALLGSRSFNDLVSGSDILAQTEKVLIKTAKKVSIDLICTITTVSGISKATVIDNVKSALAAQINTLPLGSDVNQSDIIAIIETTEGVVSVNLPLLKFNLSNLTGVVDKIEIGPSQYPQLNTVIIS